jgi:hypothetical protein
VEQYGLDDLAASGEAVLAGLGPLVAGLAGLAVEAGRAVTLDAMEVLVTGRGRELLRGLVQLALDTQAEREVRLPRVTGEDGVERTRAEPGHGRPVVTLLGEVRVRRIGYRSGVKGVLSLFPRDAVLNLPPLGYSWQLQRLAEMYCRSVSYEQGHQFVLAATGVSVGKRQLEQIVVAAAADAERFYRNRDQAAAVPAAREPGQGPGQGLPPLALSADGKGVAMLPQARRRRTRAPEQRVRTFEKRAGTGEKKGCKRMASLSNLLCELGQSFSFCYLMRVVSGAGSDGDAVAECDGECVHGRFPAVSTRSAFSSFADQPVAVDMPAGDIPDPEVKQLDRGIVSGEMAAVLDDLPELEVN